MKGRLYRARPRHRAFQPSRRRAFRPYFLDEEDDDEFAANLVVGTGGKERDAARHCRVNYFTRLKLP